MKCPHQAHVAIVDGKRFIVMRNVGQIFEPKLEKIAEPELEETNFSAGIRLHDQGTQRTGGSSTDLNEFAHGAAAAEWLNAKALSGEIEQLVVIADPRTLGEMRRHYHKQLQSRIVAELAKDLTGESTQVIEQAIAAA
ncbi:host attachment protein [Altericroceibacterium xinjiangense]|uniref:baeRF12 domain-containing protein n=1 Tax=Altericroceibacterium xinjiangense TaxID=762261 RepID=UPI000F7E95F5|nr:host attachment protein [Altericroceibacterium xinjiangense]